MSIQQGANQTNAYINASTTADHTRTFNAYPNQPTRVVLDQYTKTITAPADTNNDELYAVTIPGNLMGLNDTIRVSAFFNATNNANVKTAQVTFGGDVVQQEVLTSMPSRIITAEITNRGATNAQLYCGNAGPDQTGGAAFGTGTQDTTTSKRLAIMHQKATAGDTVTLEKVLVEWIQGI
jgi:hypothetical protein